AAADQLTNCILLLFSHALTLGITESMVIVKNERSEPCHVMPSPPATDAWCRGGTSFQRLVAVAESPCPSVDHGCVQLSLTVSCAHTVSTES
ncbi:MAG: hypothetical protein J3Q66DRAFT_322375, partial [Benniella sp.]